jgi:hypothetical protein
MGNMWALIVASLVVVMALCGGQAAAARPVMQEAAMAASGTADQVRVLLPHPLLAAMQQPATSTTPCSMHPFM